VWLALLFAALFVLEQADHGGSPAAYTGAQASLCLLLVLATWPARARIKARFGHLEERRS